MSQEAISAQERLVTADELLDMGDVGPCELIDGRIVAMVPTGGEHARIESALGLDLALFVRQHALGWVMVGEVGIYTRRSPDRVRGADIAFLSSARMPAGPPRGFLEVAPELVAEIISPGDRWQAVQQKIEEYFEFGVGQVWIVEPENRILSAYRSPADIRKFSEGERLRGEGVLEGFVLEIEALFAGAGSQCRFLDHDERS